MEKSNAKELQQRIEQSQSKIAIELKKYADIGHPGAAALVAIEQANIFVAASQLAEISTRRIIKLTWFLALLTFALLVVEIRSVFFPKDMAAPIEHIQANQNQQITVPSITK
jgi:hypothetical protein